MEILVRDVFANIHYKGTADKSDIHDIHNGCGCKDKYRMGNDNCNGRNCWQCFDTPVLLIEQADKNADEEYNRDDDDNHCEGCNEDCDGCEYA
jgi:hypothetical protein